MRRKRGTISTVELIAAFVVILIVAYVIINGFLGKTAKGGEVLGKGLESAASKLNWDALTSEEQKKVEREDPVKAAESKLQDATKYLSTGEFDRAIALAQEVATSNAVSTELQDRANNLIKEAEEKKKLAQQVATTRAQEEQKRQEALRLARQDIKSIKGAELYDQQLQQAYASAKSNYDFYSKSNPKLPIANLNNFRNIYDANRVNQLFGSVRDGVLAMDWHEKYTEITVYLSSTYSNSKDCNSLAALAQDIAVIKYETFTGLVYNLDKVYNIFHYQLGLCYYDARKYSEAWSVLQKLEYPFTKEETAKLYYYASRIKDQNNPVVRVDCSKRDVSKNCVEDNEADKKYIELYAKGIITDLMQVRNMICYYDNEGSDECLPCTEIELCENYVNPAQRYVNPCYVKNEHCT